MSSQYYPRLVRARVTRHEPYGFWVDFGEEKEGVVVIIAINDDLDVGDPVFPEIGSEVDAALLGYTGPKNEARLSVRPEEVEEARRLNP